MTPRAFSFNSPHGACPECQGLGAVYDFDPARIVPDDSLSLAEGAVAPWAKGDSGFDRPRCSRACSGRSGSIRHVPFGKLPKKLRDIVLFGAPGRRGHAERLDSAVEGAARIRSAPTSKA